MILHRFPASWMPKRDMARQLRVSAPGYARTWVRAEYRSQRARGRSAFDARLCAIGYAVAVLGCNVSLLPARQRVAS